MGRKRVAHIKEISDDDETAHSEEDDLYVDVLETISERRDVPLQVRAMVKEALKVGDMNFARWRA